MINKNIIQNINNKQMDRKDFLKYGGLAILSLAGVGKVVSILTQAGGDKSTTGSHQKVARGFGGGPYGA